MKEKIYKEIKDGVALIKPNGMLIGGSESVRLDKMLLGIEKNCVRACLIDFSNIRWINSPGIGFLAKRKNSFKMDQCPDYIS